MKAATCKVTGACPAAALCEGGKTLPLSDRSEGALTILRSFEIASQIKRFKKLLAPYAILELRMCSTVRGEFGKRAAEKLARTLNVIVIAYENPVNALGLPAFVSDEWNTQKKYNRKALLATGK